MKNPAEIVEPAEQALTVHALSVLTQTGEERTHHVVNCPRQRRALPFGECQKCDRLVSAELDPHDVHSTLTCRPGCGRQEAGPRVLDAMAARALCVVPELPLDQLVMAFIDQGMAAAAVVDAGLKLLGIVSATDLLREHYEVIEDLEEHREARTFGKQRVRDVMTAIAVTISPTAPLSEAARIMRDRRIHQLPVVSEQGTLVGMLSTLDLTSWYASSAHF
jgi:CBS domain-containing protein